MGSEGITRLKITYLKTFTWHVTQRDDNSVGIQYGHSGEGVYAVRNTLWRVIDSAVYVIDSDSAVIEQFET